MRYRGLGLVLVAVALTCAPAAALGAQVMYAAGGVGPTPVLEGRSGNRNVFGTVGYQGRGSLGGRVSGVETVSRLWLTADLTFQPAGTQRVWRPYALVGAGVVIDFSETDPVIAAGAGLRAQLQRSVFAFAEVRLHSVIGSPASGPHRILPITFGLGLGR